MDWLEMPLSFGYNGRVRCEPGWSLGEECSSRLKDFDLWFVWSGSGGMKIDEVEIPLVPGTCVWMRPGRKYIAEQDPANRLGVTYIHFSFKDNAGQVVSPDRLSLPREHYELEDVATFDLISSRVISLLRSGAHRSFDEKELRQVQLESLFRSLLCELATFADITETQFGMTRHHRSLISQHVQQIHESPGDSPTVTDLARQAGYSADHYSRVFKSVTGLTPQELSIRAKIERAKRLLSESALSIGEIADVLGYEDVFFFSRQFKQKAGTSPSAYRKKLETI